MRRRKFLGISALFSAAAAHGVPLEISPDNIRNRKPKLITYTNTFRAYIDTLLPADKFSPAGSDLDVHTQILTAAEQNEDYGLLIARGCEWLNAAAKYEGAAKDRFEALEDKQRVRVVSIIESFKQENRGPYRFFKATLAHATRLYYSTPKAWSSIGYAGPPQPGGFADHDQMPK